ncbi:MAG TPA: hypothetical protein VGF48_22030 [Thermoanaerobaculia bacterium]|jgi:hypothetical protein
MARRKTTQQAEPYDTWEYYQSIQLTSEQKAVNHAEVERKMAEVAATGVYEKLLAMMGRVHLEYDIDELREDRD